ncbi:MAG: hypothetical protein ACPGN3_10755 [Opitutales bacterium]
MEQKDVLMSTWVHPNKETQTVFNRLMGGSKHGYVLTPEEIETACEVAMDRAETIFKWASRNRNRS